jgi:hypothetical protein
MVSAIMLTLLLTSMLALLFAAIPEATAVELSASGEEGERELGGQIVEPLGSEASTVVMFETSHDQFTSDFPGWISDLQTAGYVVTTDDGDLNKIGKADILIIPGARGNYHIIGAYTDAEAKIIASYVNSGGNLILLSDWGPDYTVDTIEIAEELGVTLNKVGKGWTTFTTSNFDTSHPIMSGISEIEFFAHTTIASGGNSLIWTDLGEDVAVTLTYGQGCAVIFTDYNWPAKFENGYNTYDNAKLAMQTVGWLEICAPPNQPPSKPTAVSQCRLDGVTVIPEEQTTPESTVVFKATVSDPNGDSVRLEIELRQMGEAFTGEPTSETISDFVPSGTEVTITRYGLVNAEYHWQYRAKDINGDTSNWTEFGTPGNIDFRVSSDIYWLAKTIASEAGSVYDKYLGEWVRCSDVERISVGWTVLNRLDSGRFENSIKAIVTSGAYAHNQEPTKEIEDLAKKLLERKTPDPTDGATHFFSPIKWETQPDPRIYGPYKISGTDVEVLIPYWAIPIGYSEESLPPSYWEITPSYRTIDTPTTEWISGLEGVRNRYFMFYRPWISQIDTRIESPGELRVYDSQGRVTGLVNGTVMIEIPRSDYFENTVTIFFPNDTYRYEVAGTSEGSYGLTVTAVTRQENITFSAIDIPVSVEAIHQYSIDWTALSQGEEGATVQVDSDGDGLFEHTFTSDSELTQSEFLAQTTPPPLSASISPLSASILVGQSVTFTSTVSGGYTPYSYQWYLNSAPVSGATSASWTFIPTTSGIYYVHLKITDAKGNTAQSDAARITVATVPVGGYSIPIQVHTKTEPVLPYIALIATLTAIFTKLRPKTKRKR